MKRKILFILLSTVLLFSSCKKEKTDAFSEVSNKWRFKSITIDNINPQGVVYKTKTFGNAYEANDIEIDNSGMYQVAEVPYFMFNANYCYLGQQKAFDTRGVWEFDSKKEQIWFDKGETEYFGGESGLKFSQKYNFKVVDDQMILESSDPLIIADFGYNVGYWYFGGRWYKMTTNDSTYGDYDGYRNGFWMGYYTGTPNYYEDCRKKDAFYSYWSIGVFDKNDVKDFDTIGAYQYPNYKIGYEAGYARGKADGILDASTVNWTTDKTYKMKIVYTKL